MSSGTHQHRKGSERFGWSDPCMNLRPGVLPGFAGWQTGHVQRAGAGRVCAARGGHCYPRGAAVLGLPVLLLEGSCADSRTHGADIGPLRGGGGCHAWLLSQPPTHQSKNMNPRKNTTAVVGSIAPRVSHKLVSITGERLAGANRRTAPR